MMIIVYLALLPAAIFAVIWAWIVVGSLIGAAIGNTVVAIRDGLYAIEAYFYDEV